MAGRIRMCAEEESHNVLQGLLGANSHDQVNRESLSNLNPVLLWEARDGKVCAWEAPPPPQGRRPQAMSEMQSGRRSGGELLREQ